jgi:tryptophan 2,3-dioxygenase
MNVVVHRLKRIVEIWKLLNKQVDVLETMTPRIFSTFVRRWKALQSFRHAVPADRSDARFADGESVSPD